MENIKIIVVGETEVGKTCIINQYINQNFDFNHLPTIAMDKSKKEIEIEKTNLNLEIWDTAGQEQYRATNKIFMKGAKIALLVYDITNEESFEQINYWHETVKDMNKENIIFCLVGNKNDLYEKRVISEEKGKKFAQEKKMLFFESSAMDYESIETIFKGACQEYLNLVKEEEKKMNSMKEEERKKIEEERKTEKNIIVGEDEVGGNDVGGNKVGREKSGCVC
jgi:small GTP-binding protein